LTPEIVTALLDDTVHNSVNELPNMMYL